MSSDLHSKPNYSSVRFLQSIVSPHVVRIVWLVAKADEIRYS